MVVGGQEVAAAGIEEPSSNSPDFELALKLAQCVVSGGDMCGSTVEPTRLQIVR